VNPYDARCPLFHLDLYRLGDEGELETLGFRDLFRPDSVVLVEWADRFISAFPVDRLEVRLLHRSARTRSVVLDATGPVSGRLLTEVHGAFTSSPSPSGV
jgi:tRNA threonylcarbamoyladenosine biosynthesis protein TsaE